MFLENSDAVFLSIILILIVICTSAAIIILVFYIAHRRKTRLKPALSEIDILNALKDSKVFPVEYTNGWKLYDYVNGHQLWSHDLHMPPPPPPPPTLPSASPSPPSSPPASPHASPPASPSSPSSAVEQQPQEVATVFACFSKVKGSPQMVLNILKDIQKHDHWTLVTHHPPLIIGTTESLHPTVTHDSSAPAAAAAAARNSLTGGRQVAPSVCNDVISIQSSSNSSSSSSLFLSNWFVSRQLPKRLLQWIPIRFRQQKSVTEATIQRFWQREENGCCWLLEYESVGEDWTFCLMQPIEGWFETDRCILTLMFSLGQTQNRYCERQMQRQLRRHCERMVVKLCSVRDYLQNRRIQTVPLVRLSLTYPDSETTPQEGSSGPGGGGGGALLLTSADNSRSKESKSASKDSSQDVSLLQKFKNLIELKRESYEVEKRRKAARAMSTSSAATVAPPSTKQDAVPATTTAAAASIQSPFDLLRKLSPSKSFDQGRGFGKADAGEAKRIADQVKEQTTTPAVQKKEILENGGKEEDDLKTSGVAKNTLRRRMPLLNEIGRSKSVKSSDMYSRESEIVGEKVEEKDVADGKRIPSLEEISESLESVDQSNKDGELENQFKLIAEATIADLIAEKGRVSQLNITSSYKEQAKTTGGWTYRGLEKDTVILQKEVDDDNPIHSYLGKGMVPASPMLVYEILRKPPSRKTYDSSLQKVQVLHEFQSGLKIVYMMYHEDGRQSPKKQCHDFCLLQSEKCEGKRYIISLQSVDWPKCKELENVTRVKMSSSGWIIEPVVKGKDVFSMITYITQMDLGPTEGGSSSSSDYLEEFAAKQPVCIIALRQYLSTLNDTQTTSSAQLTTDYNSYCSPQQPPTHQHRRHSNASLSAAL